MLKLKAFGHGMLALKGNAFAMAWPWAVGPAKAFGAMAS